MEIRAILLAAGRGERLRPLTDAIPKAALPVLGVPLGAWGMAALKRVEPHVLVNTSWLGAQVEAALGGPGVEFFDEVPEPFGTAGTLKALEDRLGSQVIVHNCDLVTDLNPADLVATHRRTGAPGTVAVVRVAAGADFVHEGPRATRFVDRRREDVPGVGYMGMAVFERAAVATLPGTRPLGLGETLLKQLADSGDLAVHVHDGYRLDVGTPEALERAAHDVATGSAPAPPPGRSASSD